MPAVLAQNALIFGTSRCSAVRSFDQTLALSPYGVSFASRATSSRSSNRCATTTGPNPVSAERVAWTGRGRAALTFDLAAHAGFQILEAGGNAIDAGVASGIAMGVLQTDKVNFGGVAPLIVYLAKKGADGVIDISPFTCMNGIVCEAIYPKLSRDLGGIPIRNFYFDGIPPRSRSRSDCVPSK